MAEGATNSSDHASLIVNGAHFREILTYIRRLKGLGRKPALFSHEAGQLRVELPDCRLAADATGSWPRAVFVSLTDLRRIARELTVLDGPMTIRIENDRLRIGGFSARFTLQN